MNARFRWGHTQKENLFWGYFMVAPSLLGLGFFFIWPILQTFYFSLTKWGDFGKYRFTGLDNYKRMIVDPYVRTALFNTLRYAILSVPLSIAISIFIAVLLNQKIKGISVYRTLFFLPVVTMPAAIALVWGWLYNGDFGLINQTLHGFWINGPRWITNSNLAPYSVIVVTIWSSIGYNMVIFLAGLQNISRNYYEAAMIDGAGHVSQFFKITLPVLTPTIFFVSVMSLIGAFQLFDLIWMMIGDKNVAIFATQSLVYLFYKDAFILNDKGYAAAIAILVFILILAVTMIQMIFQKKWVHYE